MLTLIRCPFRPRVTAVARKRLRWFFKNVGGRLHLNTQKSLTQRSQPGLNMLLFRHDVGAYPETSSHASCRETFGHSRLSSLIHYGLILAQRVEVVCANQSPLKKRKKKKKRKKRSAAGEWMGEHSPKLLWGQERATTNTTNSEHFQSTSEWILHSYIFDVAMCFLLLTQPSFVLRWSYAVDGAWKFKN